MLQVSSTRATPREGSGWTRALTAFLFLPPFWPPRRLTAVLSLEIEKKRVVERLTSRRVCRRCGRLYNLLTDPPPGDMKCEACGGEIYQRSDDTKETVLHRMDVYEEQTQPLKDYFGAQGKLLQIDGNLNVEKVHAEIERRLRAFAV